MREMPQNPIEAAKLVMASIERTGGDHYAVLIGYGRRVYYTPTSGKNFARIESDEDKVLRQLAGIYDDESLVEQIAEDIEVALMEYE